MKAFVALTSLIWVVLPGPASLAATCPESVPAPKYQVGDRFTWKYPDGKEKVWEVTGFDGNLAQVKWSDEQAQWVSDSATSRPPRPSS